MQRLAGFIQESRTWSRAVRGTDLLRRVACVLRQHFDIDAGMFIYKKRFLRNHFGQLDTSVRVYEPWGMTAPREQLEGLVHTSKWCIGSPSFECSGVWEPISELPHHWQRQFERSGLAYVGAWPVLDADRVPIGAMVFGRRNGPLIHDEDVLSICAEQVSLIVELIVQRRRAEDASRRDPLTGLLNRRGLMHFLPDVQADAKSSGAPIVVGMADVNSFKRINDQYGHARGDDVLLDIAGTLLEAIGQHGLAARIGGDEFVFLYSTPGATAERVRQEVIERFQAKPYDVCVGCVSWTEEMDWHMCLDAADSHLYARKGYTGLSRERV
ncbi:GGDEF domain-containing protein [Alicyclobacillus fastidiosus]|uniref:GGDEF domain-containing protein n=1 Tax=Alicyclobacillus fastidiosus TaxID=392011 RepID=A0ABV5AHG5_9BACL|nr:GGDEF domain-containing protein [Alicyclobacillus fastidiosus]WEH09208.1 GGDEF domain-containing protein [Alicyclobacillus fastidiosus]